MTTLVLDLPVDLTRALEAVANGRRQSPEAVAIWALRKALARNMSPTTAPTLNDDGPTIATRAATIRAQALAYALAASTPPPPDTRRAERKTRIGKTTRYRDLNLDD